MTVVRVVWPGDKRDGPIGLPKEAHAMAVTRIWPIIVRRAPGRPSQARVQLSHGVRPAAIGRASVRPMKRDGDGGTPLGRFPVRLVLYRADRVSRPRVPLPVRAIAWCDDPDDRNYNRLIRLTPNRSAEGLMRHDTLYDYVLVLGHNDCPRIKGRGSAIFVHLARPQYTPTEGCIAFSHADLSAVLAEIRRGSCFLVLR